MEPEEILKILESNKGLNFVQRILNPGDYPKLSRPDLGEGASSTHLMSYATDDSGAFVYPEIIQDESGKLVMMQRREARDYAVKNKQLIRFKDPTKAAAFSTEYKKYWDMMDQMDQMDKALNILGR